MKVSIALVTLAICLAQAAPRSRSEARAAARPRPAARPEPKAQPKSGIFDDSPSFNQRKSFEQEEPRFEQERPRQQASRSARKARPEPQIPIPVGPPVIAVEPSIPVPVIADPLGPAAYQYQWEVSDPEGNNFYGHGERRDGAFTSGSYFVLLPDGRRQRVDYTVNGDEGYVATVSYD